MSIITPAKKMSIKMSGHDMCFVLHSSYQDKITLEYAARSGLIDSSKEQQNLAAKMTCGYA